MGLEANEAGAFSTTAIMHGGKYDQPECRHEMGRRYHH
jgi:hypothetical protein